MSFLVSHVTSRIVPSDRVLSYYDLSRLVSQVPSEPCRVMSITSSQSSRVPSSPCLVVSCSVMSGQSGHVVSDRVSARLV